MKQIFKAAFCFLADYQNMGLKYKNSGVIQNVGSEIIVLMTTENTIS